MYWYYKVFIAAIVGFLLFGVYSALDINMNISTSFFSKDDIEESASTDTAKEDQNNTNKNLVKTVSLDQALTASQQSKLRHAQEIFKKHQLLDDAYEKAMEVLEDKSLILFTKGWYQVADFINE
ncbi:MAG: hypothetical protein HRT88_23625, partial [Lentisphaeraceae bacterium]|nr:hypothetical protein [Lentisphaeraceae bacterium]